jgi:hypothetical protein
MSDESKRKILAVLVQLLIVLFLLIGSNVPDGKWQVLYDSYYADIALPFGLYFLLSISTGSWPVFTAWQTKAAAVFGLCSLSETLQYFGVYALAIVFDPLDFLMYAIGVLAAVFVDRRLFPRLFPFWQ